MKVYRLALGCVDVLATSEELGPHEDCGGILPLLLLLAEDWEEEGCGPGLLAGQRTGRFCTTTTSSSSSSSSEGISSIFTINVFFPASPRPSPRAQTHTGTTRTEQARTK